MNNKILIKLIIPEIDKEFDVLIPYDEIIGKIKKNIIKIVNELTNNSLNTNSNYSLLDIKTGNIFKNNISVYETNIRNATELILIKNVN